MTKEMKLMDARNRVLIIEAALSRAMNDEDYWNQVVEDSNDSASLQEAKRILEKKIDEVKQLKISLLEAKAAIKLIELDENQWIDD